MNTHLGRTVPVAVAGLAVGLVLAGCGSTGGSAGSGMMGGGPRYHRSALKCAAPASLPGRVVRVTLSDMGMPKMMGGVAPMGARMRLRAVPAAVPAGPVSLVASNVGRRTHEVVIMPLADGAAPGELEPGADGKVDETGSLGEASASCAEGSGEGIEAGTVGWVTVTLPPGSYELVCNLRNHYANGMYDGLVVS